MPAKGDRVRFSLDGTQLLGTLQAVEGETAWVRVAGRPVPVPAGTLEVVRAIASESPARARGGAQVPGGRPLAPAAPQARVPRLLQDHFKEFPSLQAQAEEAQQQVRTNRPTLEDQERRVGARLRRLVAAAPDDDQGEPNDNPDTGAGQGGNGGRRPTR